MYRNNTLSKGSAAPAICKHAVSSKQCRSDDVLLERWQRHRRSTSRSRVHLTIGWQPIHTVQYNRNCSFQWPSGNETALSVALALLFLATENSKKKKTKPWTNIKVRQRVSQLRGDEREIELSNFCEATENRISHLPGVVAFPTNVLCKKGLTDSNITYFPSNHFIRLRGILA